MQSQPDQFNYSLMPALLEAGVNQINFPVLTAKIPLERRQEIRREFVAAMKQYDISYSHWLDRTVEEQVEDDNFLPLLFLDEPFHYFPERAKMSANERNQIIQNKDAPLASQIFQRYIKGMLDEVRSAVSTENKMPGAADISESMAWYYFKNGAQHFWIEGWAPLYLEQIGFLNYYFDLNIPETTENYVRLIAAFERGASKHFGDKPWGTSIGAGTPQPKRLEILQQLYDRGATYFYIWAFHEDGGISFDETINLLNSFKAYYQNNAPSKTTAKTAILIPANYNIPTGAYYPAEVCSTGVINCKGRPVGTYGDHGGFWNMISLVKDDSTNPHLQILQKVGETIKEALAASDEFDILVNDESLRPDYLNGYERVIRVE